jgi:Rrf2 family protein
MMKVSTRSTYAIRALVYLARTPGEKPTRLASIAEKQKIPLPYLAQIFSKLRKAGLVESVHGPQGGYRLTKNPYEITLSKIVQSLEGPLEPVLCSMPENKSPQCREVEGCISRIVCNEIESELSRVLSRNNLGVLCGNATKAQGVGFQSATGSIK